LVGIVCAWLCITAGMAQPSTANHEDTIDQIATAELQKQHIPGMTVAVALNGRIVYSKGFGIASLENDAPANAETLIRTGSLAKPITAAAALALVDAGKLDLDAPIQKYCPAFPNKRWKITTRELLTHTSGIRHYSGDQEIASTRHYKTIATGLQSSRMTHCCSSQGRSPATAPMATQSWAA
jgi:CubicO group peptidase (beta-lactamase class C family)